MKWLSTVGVLVAMALVACSGCGPSGERPGGQDQKGAVTAIEEIGGKVECLYDQNKRRPDRAKRWTSARTRRSRRTFAAPRKSTAWSSWTSTAATRPTSAWLT